MGGGPPGRPAPARSPPEGIRMPPLGVTLEGDWPAAITLLKEKEQERKRIFSVSNVAARRRGQGTADSGRGVRVLGRSAADRAQHSAPSPGACWGFV